MNANYQEQLHNTKTRAACLDALYYPCWVLGQMLNFASHFLFFMVEESGCLLWFVALGSRLLGSVE